MKRVVTILVILLLPLSVWAMTPVTDSDLSNVTGQSGVSINADLTMNIGIGTLAWGDADGVNAYWPTAGINGRGYVGVRWFDITNLRIKARETDHYGVGYGTVYSGSYGTAYLKPITIDVGSSNAAGRTFVRFGLGALQITMNQIAIGVAMGPTYTINQLLGTVVIGAMGIYFNPDSYVDIYSHGGSGVSMDLNIIIDQFNLSYIAWGDVDGLPGGNTGTGGVVWMAGGTNSTRGYIGLQNLSIGGPISITGTVAIDVANQLAGVYNHGAPSLTICHISFPNLFNVNVAGPITANVRLSDLHTLAGPNAGTLGDIFISGFNLDIGSGSWIDIWAH